MVKIAEKFEKNETIGMEPLSISEKINNFIQKKRKVLVIGMISIIVLLVVLIAVLSIRDTLQSKALSKVEDFTRRYEVLRVDVNEPSKETEVTALVDELAAFAPKNSGYAGARGYAMLASIHGDKKNWEAAEKAWTNAARIGAKTYLAPVSLFNAAVAAEEQDNIPGAIALYEESVSLGAIFPAAPKAQFSIGRLQEAQNNKDAAIEAYRTLMSTWPNDTTWTNLAQNRIIFLTAQ
ncbi:MAG: tetratricopeptide repeat protein [Treponema sp.]|jgi:cytochrome c-type biogenesis protein CcmH/NrfG|nr:tetratricopeptide repeat protein [Treponema sp.]